MVARELLGKLVVSQIDDVETAGLIVETEAYVGPHDDASHAAARIGRTRRNASMFGTPGIAYVYRIYGAHWCLNVVTDAENFGAAVLIRAIQPVRGLDAMRRRRPAGQRLLRDTDLASGPGRLASALGVTGAFDAHPLQRSPLWVAAAQPVRDAQVRVGPRIGVTRAADLPLRFVVADSPWISRR
ncbi:DNA-3-methyladenine glycosylase [soil metagenome]